MDVVGIEYGLCKDVVDASLDHCAAFDEVYQCLAFGSRIDRRARRSAERSVTAGAKREAPVSAVLARRSPSGRQYGWLRTLEDGYRLNGYVGYANDVPAITPIWRP